MEIIVRRKIQSTWSALKNAAEAGTLDGIVQSGDLIPVTLKSGEEIVLKVAHDENGKTFFVMKDCMENAHCMTKERTDKGGWAACDMREYLNAEVYELLPDDLQAVISPTTIVQIVDGKRIEGADKLFLLSKTQVFGKGNWSEIEPEDTRLDCYYAEKDRIKHRCGSAGNWWLRSPLASSSTNFCFVSYGGGAYYNYASFSYGVSWGFCIN